MRTGSAQVRLAPHLRANQGRLLALDPSDSSSPDESESEDRSDSGTADSGLGSASSVDDTTGVAADSDDTDPPVMQGTCLLSWGSYECCLDWFMCVVCSR